MKEQNAFDDMKFGWKDKAESLKDLDRRLQDLMAEAPSDAAGTLLILSAKHRYRAMIAIESLQTKMAASCEGTDFGQMMDCLFDKIRSQIVSDYDRRRSMT